MVQITTTKSWGSRLVGALMGVFVGLAMIIGSFILIFWNEGHGLHTAQSLQEALKVVITVPAAPVDEKNNHHVVYFTGLATTSDTLRDELFGVSENAINLKRNIEMYQWKENVETTTQNKLGGGEEEVKTYSYVPLWSSTVINSSAFKEPEQHKNPESMPVKSKEQTAKIVTVGDFRLPPDLVSQMSGATPIDLKDANLEALSKQFGKPVKHTEDGLYVGESEEAPKIGDLRVTMAVILPQNVSIIAEQTDSTLQPYQAHAGQTVSLLEMGAQSPQLMIDDALSSNALIMWILRAVALFCMMIGLGLIMAPVVVLADFVPFFGSLVGFGTGLIAFAGGLILWSVALAIAWFVVRPLWSLGIIVIAVMIGWFVLSRKHKSITAANKLT